MHQWQNVQISKDGRYRIEGIPSGPLEVHAIAKDSDAAPLDLTIEIPEQPRQIERDLVLPRGLIVTGRVVDGATGQGVAKASIRYEPKPENSRTPTVFGFMKETDADGRFRIVVPAGPVLFTSRASRRSTRHCTASPSASPADPQVSREVKGQAGQTVSTADFRLSRAPGVVLHVVDPSGRPVPNARVDIREMGRWPNSEPGRTDSQGHHDVVGLAAGQVTVLDISSDNPPLGATIEVEADRNGGSKTVNVRLEPLVTLSGASSTRRVDLLPARWFTFTVT